MRQLVHRADHVFWFLIGIIPGIVNYLVWTPIFGDRTSINGFQRENIITYFLTVAILWYFVGGTINYFIGKAIKDGQLNFLLIKPMHPILRFAFIEQGWKIGSLVVTIPIFFGFMLLFGKTIPIQSFAQVILFVVAVFFSTIIFSIWDQIIGMSAFFIDEISPVNRLNRVLYALLSGQAFPLAFMPVFLANINKFLFYRYTFSFPAEILFTPQTVNYTFSFSTQIAWILVLIAFYKLVYKIGIKRYEAYGS